MSTKLNTLKQKAYLQYQGDGLLDIVIGLAISGFGLSMIASGFLVLTWLPILLYMPLKGVITVPRFGYVEFDSEIEVRKKQTRLLTIGILSLSLFTGFFFWQTSGNVSPAFDDFLSKYVLLVLGLFIALGLLAGAYMLGIRRFYAYAAMTILVLWGGIELGITDYIFVIGLGILFLIPGSVLLWRFIQNYPLDRGNE